MWHQINFLCLWIVHTGSWIEVAAESCQAGHVIPHSWYPWCRSSWKVCS